MPLDEWFPHLKATGYQVTSPASPDYNCIAWAATEDIRWWEPDPQGLYYWPETSPREFTLEAYLQAFTNLGYTSTETAALEPGFEKIAIYVNTQGKPTHAARQLANGRWTSKLGRSEDIEHSLEGLEGTVYGLVAQILRRPIGESRTS